MTMLTFAPAWIPFFEPVNFFQDWWFLLSVPMAFFISMVYKAMRVKAWRAYWRHVVIMTFQILAGMMALLLALFVLVEFILPRLPAE